MKRTSAPVLFGAAVIGLIVGFGIDQVLTAMSRPTFTPAYTLPIALVVIAAGVLILALPIRRAKRTPGAARVDPFRAVRVAVLARASSLLGAGIGGAALGLAAFVLSRPVAAQVGSITVILVTVAASAVLVAAALVAESFCTLPKDDDDDSPGPDDAGAAPADH